MNIESKYKVEDIIEYKIIENGIEYIVTGQIMLIDFGMVKFGRIEHYAVIHVYDVEPQDEVSQKMIGEFGVISVDKIIGVTQYEEIVPVLTDAQQKQLNKAIATANMNQKPAWGYAAIALLIIACLVTGPILLSKGLSPSNAPLWISGACVLGVGVLGAVILVLLIVRKRKKISEDAGK